MAQTTDDRASAKSGLLTINRRQVLGGVFAGAAVTTLPACSAPSSPPIARSTSSSSAAAL